MRLKFTFPAVVSLAFSAALPVHAADGPLQVYGQIRADVIYDDSRPDAAQTPTFILSEPAGQEDRANFTMHPRLSRLGVDFQGPALDGFGEASVSGKLEFDFQNGGRESRAIARYRHAFVNLSWRTFSLLVGQTSDTISPLFPAANGDTLMWNAGNLGDRRMQVRLTYQSQGQDLRWSAAGALGLTGGVDQKDLDADGIRDGEATGMPNYQARLGLSYPLGAKRLSVGLWGFSSNEEVTNPIAGRTSFDGQVVGLDFEVPLGARFLIRGESWTGSNLSDVRGGIGQSVNLTTGEEIDSRGGWIEAGGNVVSKYQAFIGYTLDRPDAEQIPVGGRTRNTAFYLANRFSLSSKLMLGLDVLRWRTEYRGVPEGVDNRFNAYVIHSF
jgi:hypothetical protein